MTRAQSTVLATDADCDEALDVDECDGGMGVIPIQTVTAMTMGFNWRL